MDKTLALQSYIIPFLLAFGCSVLLTIAVRWLAQRLRVYDQPEQAPERKVHAVPVPLLGGLAIYLTVAILMIVYATLTHRLLGGYLLPKHLIGILVGGLLIMIGGYLDDKYNLKAAYQIIWPILAVVVVIASGIGIRYITNPFGGIWQLDTIQLKMLTVNHIPYYLTLGADIFAFIWLLGMTYTTKFLDGLDGLVSGITTIGAIVLFFLSINKEVAQPETALLACLLAGAAAGFLVFNFHPAKIFLGEGGSLLTGYLLGVLAIISGAKIATALLIIGIPMLDVLWVIVRRTFFEKRSPFTTADRKHLHFRLLDLGLSHRQAVLVLYAVSLLFGSLALFSGSREKLILLAIVSALMVLAVVAFAVYYRRSRRGVPPLP